MKYYGIKINSDVRVEGEHAKEDNSRYYILPPNSTSLRMNSKDWVEIKELYLTKTNKRIK